MVTQSKDIPDQVMMAAIRRDMEERGTTALGACWWTIAKREGWPEKVVLAKCRKLVKRGMIDGCGCGCRGDFCPK